MDKNKLRQIFSDDQEILSIIDGKQKDGYLDRFIQLLQVAQGKDGYNPEKGKDFYTPEEIASIKQEILTEATPNDERLTSLIIPLIPEPIQGEKGEPGIPGKPADEQRIFESVLASIPDPIPGKDGSPDTPEIIAEKLNTLKDAIDASVIKDGVTKKEVEQISSGMKVIDGRIKLIDQRWGAHGGGGGSSANAFKVKVDGSDTTGDYLDAKISVSGGLIKTITNPGGNEVVNIDGTGVGAHSALPLNAIQQSDGMGGFKTQTSGGTVLDDTAAFPAGTNALDLQSYRSDPSQVASGNCSAAYGNQNTASGYNSAAFGVCNTISNASSTGVGQLNTVSGYDSLAVGFRNSVTGNFATASGYCNTVSAYGGTGSGYANVASSFKSSAMGSNNLACGSTSSALGAANMALNDYASAVGFCNNASGTHTSAFGASNIAMGDYSVSMGNGNTSCCYASSAVGTFSTASGYSSSAFGYSNTASNYYTTAVGYGNCASGVAAVASGFTNTASGGSSVAIGGNNLADDSSVAMGYSNTAYNASTAVGSSNCIIGIDSVAIGVGNINADDRAAAIGYSNHIGTPDSTAIGISNCTIGATSVAVGIGNTSSGLISAAVGWHNITGCDQASALGYQNTASGYNSSAMGGVNNAYGRYSTASGAYNNACCDCSSVFGSFITNNIAGSTQIGPNDTAKVTILDSGYVGLGTTTPSVILQANISDNSGIGFLMTGKSYDGTTDNSAGVALVLTHNASSNRQFALVDSSTGDGVRFIANNLDAITAFGTRADLTLANDSTGVYVNGTGGLPTSKLGVNLTGSSAGTTGFSIRGSSGQTANYVTISTNGSSSGDIFNVDSSGNVGIGTTSPGAKLEVNGGGADVVQRLYSGDATKFAYLTLGRTGEDLEFGVAGAASQFFTNSSQGSGILKQVNTGGNLMLGVGSGDASMTFINGGNVGIGTATPSDKLNIVSNDDAFNPGFVIENTANGTNSLTGIAFNDSSGVRQAQSLFVDSNYVTTTLRNTFITGTVANIPVLYYTNNTQRGQITAGGDFQFGSSNQFQVDTSGNIDTSGILTVTGSGDSSFVGNVGVGTSTPGAKLEVNGTALFDDTITVSSAITQGSGPPGTILTNFQLYVDTVTGIVYVN